LIRLHDRIRDQTACLLVDASPGVDVSSLIDIEDDEYLAGILLTHAHLDHYETLPENHVQNAPIYAFRDTARILDDVLHEARTHHDLGPVDDVLGAVEPIDDWTSIVDGVRVRPIPAGHAPGAAGFLIQFQDDGTAQTLLATGDFTTRDAAGYRGFTTDLGVDVDAVFLTASTNDGVPETVTDVVSRALARARAGSQTLVTAGALQGVHLATLLAETAARFDASVPITLVGQAAKVATTLGYDLPNTEFVETFQDPSTCLEHGRITIAGPAVPIDGSAKRLFETIEADGGATLLQVTSGGIDPVDSAGCTVDAFRLSNHPSRDTIDEVVEELLPTHVVIVHQTGRAADRFKDSYDSFVWATNDDLEHTLYEDGRWCAPPWVTKNTERRVRGRTGWTGGRVLAGDLAGLEVSPPPVSRQERVDLRAEGLDIEALEARFGASRLDRDETQSPDDDSGRKERAAIGRSSPSENGSGARSAAPDGTGEADVPVAPDGSGTEARSGNPDGNESDGRPGDPADSANASSNRLAAIESRLERIESALDGATPIRARVIDLHDGVLLQPIDDGDWIETLEHGQEIALGVYSETNG
jgi:putative mRNA 3-end processing factor